MSLKASWSCLNTLFCKNKCISSNNICKVFFLYLIESCVIQLFVHPHAESASEMQRYMYFKFTFMHTPEVCSLYPPKLSSFMNKDSLPVTLVLLPAVLSLHFLEVYFLCLSQYITFLQIASYFEHNSIQKKKQAILYL